MQSPNKVVTRTLTKTVGKSVTGPIHPVPGHIPSTSDLNPSGPETAKKKHSKVINFGFRTYGLVIWCIINNKDSNTSFE